MTADLEPTRHTLAHLLAAALLEIYGAEIKLAIGPAIETGFYYDVDFPDNFSLSDQDLPGIEEKMKEILPTWKSFSSRQVTAEEARRIFSKNQYKLELIDEVVQKGEPITLYKAGQFEDLCRGGHSENPASQIKPDSFKLDRLAGAYWRGSEKNKQLTRIYGLAFQNKEDLDHYLWQREETKKRDHRLLGEQLKLFTFAKEVGPGLPLWLPKGTILREKIEELAKEVEAKWGYQRVSTPHIAKEDLYKMSGHIPYYAESMYPPMKLDDGDYYLKAMNCPHTHMIYRSQPHSYRDLPLRYAEYGTVYRYELSGTLAGLLRVRGFTQNDAHIYCRQDQVEEEFLKVMKLHEYWYEDIFGITDFYLRLSLPAEDKAKFAGLPEGWAEAVKMLRAIMEKSGLPYQEAEGEAAFYGPKVDFQIKSVTGREETASTNQLDFVASQRFNLTYTDKDGTDKPVYVIHRAPLGSHERFIAFLIEHYAGAFPLWLSPVQIVVHPISDKHSTKASEIAEHLTGRGFRVEISMGNETIGKRIREAETQKTPYSLILGDKDIAADVVSVRKRSGIDLGQMSLEKFSQMLSQEVLAKKL